ncbi:hypothetical protein ANO14919_121430 [Xylariales sp. No.14919]|nr:hypothetical protein ANO14919_121430 [Xylariales sp. No.14919]
MEAGTEPTPPADHGDTTSNHTETKKRLAGKYKCQFLPHTRLSSNKSPILTTLAFLVGSVVFIILSQVVQAKRSPLGQQVSSSLSPSCTDFGDSVEEQRFALDLAYGNFTFTQAKIIDVTWDTVVGQGGRLLHGWILYRCIIYPLLILAMEISTVTYPYYTTFSFSKASFETLAQLLKTLHLTRSWSVLLCTILLIYSLTYTLFFSLIWGTATGYLSLSHKLYAMPGGDIIPLTSEDLSLCWVLDPTRQELQNESIPHIEVGPSFSEILSTHQSISKRSSELCLNITSRQYHLQYGFGGWTLGSEGSTIWDILATMGETGFEDFFNIQRYALTRQFLQIGLDASDWLRFGWKANLSELQARHDDPVKLDWFSTAKSTCRNISQPSLYPTLHAVTLEGPGTHPLRQDATKVDIYPYNASAEPAYWSLFVLDQSIQLEPGLIPYNSTIRLNDTPVPLHAPFLDVGFNCSGPNINDFNGLGNCACYKGQPIPLNLLEDPICNTAPGYVWGFSSFLTRLGLIMEAVWMACCSIAYPWLLHRSKILTSEPVKSAKALRLLLDCAEAVYNDVGPDAKDLCEDEITRRLENIEIGYRAEECEGRLRYRIVSGPKTEGFSERFNKATFTTEVKIAKKAQAFETTLNRTVPVLKRIGDSTVHERMNRWLDGVIAAWREFLAAGRPRPTASEVYEDANWRF